MSFTDGSYMYGLYKKAISYKQNSILVNSFKKLGNIFKCSIVYKSLKKFPGEERNLETGLVTSTANKIIGTADKKCTEFRLNHESIFRSSIFITRTECSKFLILPVLYFLIDYVLRNIIMVDMISSVWDEVMLAGGLFLGLFRFVFKSEGAYGKTTPVGIPIILFIMFFVSLMLINSPLTSIGIEGVRAVTQYMLWYFVAIMLIGSYADVEKIYTWFLLTGTALALHGIYQFVTNVPMPAGWVDMAEKGVRTRSFSIIGSPNILGSVMTLLIPMSTALFFESKSFFKKSMYAFATAVMALCLVFTQSRGAWIGFGVAVFVFFLIYDRKYILPLVFAGLFVFFMVPQVYDRITYMLSQEYMLSSMTGGRLVRWQNGLELLKDNFWLGTGIGRFGGAVAMNHKDLFPDTYYMDNYYLKLAVEGGILALITFVLLMLSVLKRGFGALLNQPNKRYKLMIIGMLSGMIGVMAHNFVENVFEVPAMVTYFWIITAMVIYLGYNRKVEIKELI